MLCLTKRISMVQKQCTFFYIHSLVLWCLSVKGVACSNAFAANGFMKGSYSIHQLCFIHYTHHNNSIDLCQVLWGQTEGATWSCLWGIRSGPVGVHTMTTHSSLTSCQQIFDTDSVVLLLFDSLIVVFVVLFRLEHYWFISHHTLQWNWVTLPSLVYICL